MACKSTTRRCEWRRRSRRAQSSANALVLTCRLYRLRKRKIAPKSASIADDVYNFDELTDLLSYGDSQLATTRFNA